MIRMGIPVLFLILKEKLLSYQQVQYYVQVYRYKIEDILFDSYFGNLCSLLFLFRPSSSGFTVLLNFSENEFNASDKVWWRITKKSVVLVFVRRMSQLIFFSEFCFSYRKETLVKMLLETYKVQQEMTFQIKDLKISVSCYFFLRNKIQENLLSSSPFLIISHTYMYICLLRKALLSNSVK